MNIRKRTVTSLVVALAPFLFVACGGTEESAGTAAPSPQAEQAEIENVESLAPIGAINHLIEESDPPQYSIVVESGLPNGCVEFDRYEVKIEGNLIQVAVINREPVGGAVGCSAEYRTIQNQIPLGSDLLPDTVYTLLINNVSETFMTLTSSPAAEAVAETAAPTETAEASAPSASSPAPSPDDGCTPPVGWYRHLLLPGETMFELAQRSGGTVEDLTAANCISDPSSLLAGQFLILPAPVSATDLLADDFARFYLVKPGDNGLSGTAVGCGDSLVAVSRARPLTSLLVEDIRASLEELFSVKTPSYGQTGYTHAFPDADLTVTGVTLDGSSLTVTIAGQIPLTGVCADALVEAQILFTVFQFQGFDTALIVIDGQNLKQVMDSSGMVTDDALYSRVEFPLP